MTTQLRFCPVGTVVTLSDSLLLPDGRRIYTDRELTVIHSGSGPVQVGPPHFATLADEDGNRYRVHPGSHVRAVAKERPPLRAWCVVKGTAPAFGRVGRINDVTSENGELRAWVYYPWAADKSWTHGRTSYPVAFLDWWKADCDETHGGGKPLPARPKNWKELANVPA